MASVKPSRLIFFLILLVISFCYLYIPPLVITVLVATIIEETHTTLRF